MKQLLWSFLAAATLLTLSCTREAQGDNNCCDTVPADSLTATPADTARTITGIAIDGSRRNIYLKVADDTLDYELPPSQDISWEIGDTVHVHLVATAEGDSVASMTVSPAR